MTESDRVRNTYEYFEHGIRQPRGNIQSGESPDVPCPQCGREWPDPCEQVDCIREYGKCIPCMVDDGEPPYGIPNDDTDE